jgi:hypothetical protein
MSLHTRLRRYGLAGDRAAGCDSPDEEVTMMTRASGRIGVLTAALVISTAAIPAAHRGALGATGVKQIRQLSFEFVGQFQNSPAGVTPATHTHYGYLSYIRGASAFRASPENETTALFTFFADASTLRVIVDGPLRIITRVGKLNIYRDPSPDGTFGRPETFRDGTRVLVGEFRQQVVNNTVTGSFTTFHRVRITSTRPFQAGRRKLLLGRVGQTFRISFSGQGNMPGPPSGFFGGYGVGE